MFQFLVEVNGDGDVHCFVAVAVVNHHCVLGGVSRGVLLVWRLFSRRIEFCSRRFVWLCTPSANTAVHA